MSTDDPTDKPLTPDEERVAKEMLEAKLEAYKDTAPPELVQMMREIGMDAVRKNPAARRMLTAVASRPQVKTSADLPTGGSGANGAAKEKDDGRKGGKEGA